MSELATLEDFVKRVIKDTDVSFVVAFKKDSAEEAYYAPGPERTIDDKLAGPGEPVLKERIEDALCEETYVEMKAMTILSAHGSPGRNFVHLPSCRYIKVT